MRTTTLKGEEQVFSYPTLWPRINDVIQHVMSVLSYEVKRVRPNGELLIKHISSEMVVRVNQHKVMHYYRAVKYCRPQVIILTKKQ